MGGCGGEGRGGRRRVCMGLRIAGSFDQWFVWDRLIETIVQPTCGSLAHSSCSVTWPCDGPHSTHASHVQQRSLPKWDGARAAPSAWGWGQQPLCAAAPENCTSAPRIACKAAQQPSSARAAVASCQPVASQLPASCDNPLSNHGCGNRLHNRDCRNKADWLWEPGPTTAVNFWLRQLGHNQ